ncbi:MAG: TonB-dependent receptor [bacterium]
MRGLFIGLLLFGVALVYAQKEEVEELYLGEVVVTATKEPINRLEAPSLVSVVTDKDIEKKNLQTVDQAVANLLGVYNRRGKGILDTLASVSLQGLPKQERTLVILNGVPINDPYMAGVRLFQELQPEDIEKIEVARGPFSSLYGGYAMGGVMNIFTKLPEKRIFRFKFGYGSSWESRQALDNLRNYYLSYGDKLSDKLRVFLSYGKHSTDGYPSGLNVQSQMPPAGITGWSSTTDPNGKPRYIIGNRGNNWMNNKSFNFTSLYNLSERAQLLFTSIQGKFNYGYGKPETYLRDANGNPVWEYGKIKVGSFLDGPGGYGGKVNGITYTYEGRGRMKISLGEFNSGDNWYIQPDSSKATLQGGPGKLSQTNAGSQYLDFQWSFPTTSLHNWLIGLSFTRADSDTKEYSLNNWQDRDSIYGLTYQSRGKDRSYAIYAQDMLPLKSNVLLYLGVRGEWWRTYDGYVNQVGTQGYPKVYPASSQFSLSPKIAIVTKLTDTASLKASIGKAFRAPTLYELYRTWTSALSGITYAGNPNLKPEKVTAIDLTYQRLIGGGEFCLSLFRNDLSDMIYLQKISDKLSQYANAGRGISEGIGFEWRKRFISKNEFFLNLTLLKSEITENTAKPSIVGKKFTYLPHKLFNIGFIGERGKATYSLIGQYVGKVYGDDENKDVVNNVYGSYDPYFLVNFKSTFRLSPKSSISLAIDNLFNSDYYYFYKTPGREWFIGYSLEF